MLTHVHKVIHKVVGTFARVLRGREKWTLASGAPARPVSSGRGAREGLQRANAGCGAPVHPVHGRAVADAGHRTRVVSVRCK
jgi:hypothetical protein